MTRAPLLTLPCASCGRAVDVEVGTRPQCDRCAPASHLWRLDLGPTQERVDVAELRARVQAGRIPGTTPVNNGGTRWVPLCSHPAFRTLFLPGHEDFIALVAPTTTTPFWRRWFGGGAHATGSGGGTVAGPAPAEGVAPRAPGESAPSGPTPPRRRPGAA